MQITPPFITSVTLLRFSSRLLKLRRHLWKTVNIVLYKWMVQHSMKIQQDNYYLFAKVILLNQSDNRPFMWTGWLSSKSGAIYHAVPEVHLTNHFKCSLTMHLEDELSSKSNLHASKWNSGRLMQQGLAYKTSIFVLSVDLVNVQPNRSKGCHNTLGRLIYVKRKGLLWASPCEHNLKIYVYFCKVR